MTTNAYYLRLDRGQTLQQVADATGVDAGTVSRLERGETRRPHPSVVQKLTRHYAVSAETLLRPATGTAA